MPDISGDEQQSRAPEGLQVFDALASSGLPEIANRRPVLVLAVGNLLLQDDAAGIEMLAALHRREWGEDVEFVDGGTQGLALLGQLSERNIVIVLDAVTLGDKPGAIHLLREDDLDLLRARKSSTSHESNALELLALARLVGINPEVVVVGIEPESVRTGIGLSASVRDAIPRALAAASVIIQAAKDRNQCV